MAVCCPNLPVGALSSCSAPFMLVGALFKKFGLFEHPEIQENSLRELRAITERVFEEAFQQWKNVGNSVSLVERNTLKGAVLNPLAPEFYFKF